jgi:hypothetical protein
MRGPEAEARSPAGVVPEWYVTVRASKNYKEEAAGYRIKDSGNTIYYRYTHPHTKQPSKGYAL